MKKMNKKLKALHQLFVSNYKKWLPTFHCYMHNNGVSITPHLGYQWHTYQGETSRGCVKAQIHLGWIMWSCQLRWGHNG